MGSVRKDASEKVLEYLNGLPPWSQALCRRLREIILEADSSLAEDWKWGPHYSSSGMVCGWSAFQKHVKLTFFNGSAMSDPDGLFNHCVDNEFSRSIKFTNAEEIDAPALSRYIHESVAVNQNGYKRQLKEKTVYVPEELQQALALHPQAAAFFEGLSYGYKKEFAEHVAMAKQEKTKRERIAKVVALCAANRKLNDKYKKEVAGG